MQVAKWGNSLAIRIPAAVAQALKLRAGDEIEIHVGDRAVSRSRASPAATSCSNACAAARPPARRFRLRPGRGE